MPLLEELPGTFEGRGQVGGAAPASRTPPPPPPRPATDHSVAFPHLLCGFLCLEKWTKLSSGANCPGPRAQTTCQLVQVGVLLVCPSPTRGWGPHWGGY